MSYLQKSQQNKAETSYLMKFLYLRRFCVVMCSYACLGLYCIQLAQTKTVVSARWFNRTKQNCRISIIKTLCFTS